MSPALSFLTLFTAITRIALAQDTSLTSVKAAFDTANIAADADIVFEPTVLLEVALPATNTTPAALVHAGVQLPRNETVGPPIFAISDPASALRDDTFVVATIDLDAPTPQDPSEAEIRHFLGSNFKLTRGALLANFTPAISNWLQPTPPAGSDPHRYVFLLFKQPAGFNEQTLVNSSTSVTNFNLSSFAAAVGLGNPLGGTFMLVGPDPAS
ncbi:hypothetical protein PLICRDRAFT_33328 [Plicaturopsis crispa FD-325 SS-3]|nr:hypothetical protein PLICRDRAFT_33328 [Plicaturopsis crispa FD-325 SS-3]